MAEGWIKAYRKIQDHWVWQDKPFSYGQAWFDLIFMAQHSDNTGLYRGAVQERKRGTAYVSIKYLAEKWGWSANKVRRFLEKCEHSKMCHVNGTTNGTTVTIENYEKYQDRRQANESADESAGGTQYKNDKNDIYNTRAREEENPLTDEEREQNIATIKEMIKRRFVN